MFNKFLSDPLELRELEGALGSLPRKKSPGHDCILNKHLIHGGAALNDLLLSLFNSVLKHTSVPEGWQTSIIIPIYKGKGKDKNDPSS